MIPILFLFFLSGISGLVYQVVWIRLFSHLLGGSSLAISTVLAVFMGGLALGSRFFGKRVDRARRPLRLYAYLEFGIAFFGALVPFLVLAVQPVYVGVVRALPLEAWVAPRLAVALALLLPPTILMGGTLPVLARFLVRTDELLGRRIGLLYAVNTAGAVLGSFLAGFFLIEALGLVAGTMVAVAGNVVAGVITLGIDRRVAPMDVERDRERDSAPPAPAPAALPAIDGRLLALFFALSGFASLGYEIYWTRALQLFLGNTTYAFSAMLTTFLLGLAAGGWLGGQLADRVRNAASLLGWTQLAIGAAALSTVPLVWNWLPRLQASAFLDARHLEWSAYLMRRFGVAFAVMALPTFLIGMTFPIVNRLGVSGLARIGTGVGSLYFANTAGAIAGSVVAGFLVLPWLGARGAIVVTASLNGLVGLGVLLAARPRRVAQVAVAGAAALLLIATGPVLHRSGRAILSDTQESADRVLFQKEDAFAETRVYEKRNGERHMSVNGHDIGGTNANLMRKEKILAHLPLALVPRAEKVLAVGLGSGITLGTFALYDEIEELTCVEIAPGVVLGASLFADHHGDVLNEPRVRILVEDGVQFLLTSDAAFDVISSDSKLNPSYVGNAPLLSRDYYELCVDRLTETGVMVQWLPSHVPAQELHMIVRGFAGTFPHTSLFWYDPSNVILVGSRSAIALDMNRARIFTEHEHTRDDLERLFLENAHVLASLYISGDDALARAVGAGPVSTWRRPRLEFTMIRATLGKDMASHEDVMLRWLARLRDPGGLALKGSYDAEVLDRFRASTTNMLLGFAAGGGVARLETGTTYFQEGYAANPDDRRLAMILDYLAATRASFGGGSGERP
jgi:spermidine synthase